ncbi:MAG: hypothetical protein K0U12_02630 [Gammaproteobacteria bacterium]|nr:hypothetical protein [Gammaproteobacteria bacterium]
MAAFLRGWKKKLKACASASGRGLDRAWDLLWQGLDWVGESIWSVLAASIGRPITPIYFWFKGHFIEWVNAYPDNDKQADYERYKEGFYRAKIHRPLLVVLAKAWRKGVPAQRTFKAKIKYLFKALGKLGNGALFADKNGQGVLLAQSGGSLTTVLATRLPKMFQAQAPSDKEKWFERPGEIIILPLSDGKADGRVELSKELCDSASGRSDTHTVARVYKENAPEGGVTIEVPEGGTSDWLYWFAGWADWLALWGSTGASTYNFYDIAVDLIEIDSYVFKTFWLSLAFIAGAASYASYRAYTNARSRQNVVEIIARRETAAHLEQKRCEELAVLEAAKIPEHLQPPKGLTWHSALVYGLPLAGVSAFAILSTDYATQNLKDVFDFFGMSSSAATLISTFTGAVFGIGTFGNTCLSRYIATVNFLLGRHPKYAFELSIATRRLNWLGINKYGQPLHSAWHWWWTPANFFTGTAVFGYKVSWLLLRAAGKLYSQHLPRTVIHALIVGVVVGGLALEHWNQVSGILRDSEKVLAGFMGMERDAKDRTAADQAELNEVIGSVAYKTVIGLCAAMYAMMHAVFTGFPANDLTLKPLAGDITEAEFSRLAAGGYGATSSADNNQGGGGSQGMLAWCWTSFRNCCGFGGYSTGSEYSKMESGAGDNPLNGGSRAVTEETIESRERGEVDGGATNAVASTTGTLPQQSGAEPGFFQAAKESQRLTAQVGTAQTSLVSQVFFKLRLFGQPPSVKTMLAASDNVPETEHSHSAAACSA